LNSNSNFEFGPVGNRKRSGPVGPVPTVSEPVPTGLVNRGWDTRGKGKVVCDFGAIDRRRAIAEEVGCEINDGITEL
jgi:hypothetical protein